MKRNIISLVVVAALVSSPALAGDAGQKESRITNLGVVAGGVLGAIVGGPPGAIAGMAAGGIATDREFIQKRKLALEGSVAALSRERDSLRSDHRSQKARIAELVHRLEEQESLAASRLDTSLLANSLELEVGFRTDSAMLPDGAAEAIDALAGLLRAAPGLEVHLDGFADPRGAMSHNLKLSENRADAVRQRLVAAGIAPERIHLAAHGAVEALAPDTSADPDGWALQRRVSIRLETAEGRLAARP